MRFTSTILAVCVALTACSSANTPRNIAATNQSSPASPKTWRDYQPAAAAHDATLDIPVFESSPEQLDDSITALLAQADALLTDLAAQDLRRVSFESTLARLDDIYYPVLNAANKTSLMAQTQVTDAMRTAANEQFVRLSGWFVSTQYREDVYNAVSTFASMPEANKLEGPQKKLLDDTMRAYRQAGMQLDADTKTRVEAMQKQLAALSAQFGQNNNNADESITFTRDQLDGFSDEMLSRYANDQGTYTFRPTVTPEFVAIMQNASTEDTRKAMKIARYSVNKDTNIPILNEMVQLRQNIATALGYNTWADYQTETRMAKTGDTAVAFVNDLATGLEPKFLQELATLRKLKVAQTGDANAQINLWDFRYFQNQLLKQEFSIDTEQLRNYFPFNECIVGMFGVFEELFDLRFEKLQPENAWADGMDLYMCLDASTNEPMGMFYFDMFPRQGKYSHFAQFGIIDGKQLPSGLYQRPVVALVCNFTSPSDGKPSLISHDELQTLFHEFGHCLHSILTQAEFAQQAGTNVPRDFVEAPSQMLEAWTWDPAVLDRFAGHYLNRNEKVDPELLKRMKEARLATIGVHYRRQLALGIGDLRVHTSRDTVDVAQTVNDAFADVFLPTPPGTAMAAYWGHLAGYSAGYYGYAWADSIAQDMQSIFKNAPGGLMDKTIGMRLRKEIYATGGEREIDESIQAFLGRKRSLVPFLKSIGINENNE